MLRELFELMYYLMFTVVLWYAFLEIVVVPIRVKISCICTCILFFSVKTGCLYVNLQLLQLRKSQKQLHGVDLIFHQ